MLHPGKLLTLEFVGGLADRGFHVRATVAWEGQVPFREASGQLPPAPELAQTLDRWRQTYRSLGTATRIKPQEIVYNGLVNPVADCWQSAEELQAQFHIWLSTSPFRWIDGLLREEIDRTLPLRLLIRSDDRQLYHLPWHLWDLVERYANLAITFGGVGFGSLARPKKIGNRVRILAIIGHSAGIDTSRDRQELDRLGHAAEITWLVEADRAEINDRLWSEPWDLLFFAGHSQTEGQTGRIYINPHDSLTLDELRYGLRKAIQQGLRLAIFNSCDGLGLAQELATLDLPYLVLMREPVPDAIAQQFLQNLLSAFTQGTPLQLAVREARERLQGLEPACPCATWLPVLYQHPTVAPLTWSQLRETPPAHTKLPLLETQSDCELVHDPARNLKQKSRSQAWCWPCWRQWGAIVAISFAATLGIIGMRHFGLMQAWELTVYDQMLRLRPPEPIDPRIVLITLDAEDVALQQGNPGESLSDQSLAQILQVLAAAKPKVIGLDLYRPRAFDPQLETLNRQVQQTNNLIVICKGYDASASSNAVPPPLGIPLSRQGFSDFIKDQDGILRRQILFMDLDQGECRPPFSFSAAIALTYLDSQGIKPQYTDEAHLQLHTLEFRNIDAHSGGYQGIKDAAGSQILVNYRSGPQPFRQISLRQILQGKFDISIFTDKIVLIGTIDPNFKDTWRTPYSYSAIHEMPGVVVQAHMTSQILEAVLADRPLIRPLLPWQDLLWIGAWGLLGGTIGAVVVSRPWRWAILTGTLVLLGLVCQIALMNGFWLPIVPASLTILGVASLITVYTFRKNPDKTE